MVFDFNYKEDFIIKPDYKPASTVYSIVHPTFETGYIYHFKTNSGLEYEVRFAPKANNILGMVVNFTVLGDDFEQDYPVTNRGEMYSVIATVIEILKLFHHHHNLTTSYEFAGEFKENEKNDCSGPSIRTRMYIRISNQVLNSNWKPEVFINKVILKRDK